MCQISVQIFQFRAFIRLCICTDWVCASLHCLQWNSGTDWMPSSVLNHLTLNKRRFIATYYNIWVAYLSRIIVLCRNFWTQNQMTKLFLILQNSWFFVTFIYIQKVGGFNSLVAFNNKRKKGEGGRKRKRWWRSLTLTDTRIQWEIWTKIPFSSKKKQTVNERICNIISITTELDAAYDSFYFFLPLELFLYTFEKTTTKNKYEAHTPVFTFVRMNHCHCNLMICGCTKQPIVPKRHAFFCFVMFLFFCWTIFTHKHTLLLCGCMSVSISFSVRTLYVILL